MIATVLLNRNVRCREATFFEPESNEEPVQLIRFMPDRVKKHWRKNRSQHWNKSELIGRSILKLFR